MSVSPLRPSAPTPSPAAPTPGPWVWDGYALRPEHPDPGLHAVHTILEAEHLGVGFVAAELRAVRVEADANLALIAAAPALLDAARAAEVVLGRQRWRPDSTDPEAVALAKLRAAIAKVEVQP